MHTLNRVQSCAVTQALINPLPTIHTMASLIGKGLKKPQCMYCYATPHQHFATAYARATSKLAHMLINCPILHNYIPDKLGIKYTLSMVPRVHWQPKVSAMII